VPFNNSKTILTAQSYCFSAINFEKIDNNRNILHNYLMDSFDEQLENTQVDYHEIPTPKEGVAFNAKAQRDQFLGGGGSETKAQDASSLVQLAPHTAETPHSDNETREQRSKYRHELVEKLVPLEREAIEEYMNSPTTRLVKLLNMNRSAKILVKLRNRGEEVKRFVQQGGRGSSLMDNATVDAFWHSTMFPAFFSRSDEARDIRNALAKSTRDEHEEWLKKLTDEERGLLDEEKEYDQKSDLIRKKYDKIYPKGWRTEMLTEEEQEIWRKTFELNGKCLPLHRRFREEHPEAWQIVMHIGMDQRDKYGRLESDFTHEKQEEIAIVQKEAQKIKPKTEVESVDKNVEPNEPTTEQVTDNLPTDNFTVIDASGNNYQISLHGDLTAPALVEALKAKGAKALAAQVESLSNEQQDLNALLTAAKITVTPFSLEKRS
jgi:hypothetical protein